VICIPVKPFTGGKAKVSLRILPEYPPCVSPDGNKSRFIFQKTAVAISFCGHEFLMG